MRFLEGPSTTWFEFRNNSRTPFLEAQCMKTYWVPYADMDTHLRHLSHSQCPLVLLGWGCQSPTIRSVSRTKYAILVSQQMRKTRALDVEVHVTSCFFSKGSPEGINEPIGSMVLPYMVTWIPSIYPLYVSIYTSTMDPMGNINHQWSVLLLPKYSAGSSFSSWSHETKARDWRFSSNAGVGFETEVHTIVAWLSGYIMEINGNNLRDKAEW